MVREREWGVGEKKEEKKRERKRKRYTCRVRETESNI